MYQNFNFLATDWNLAINVTVTGLVIVFAMLILLVIILYVFGMAFNKTLKTVKSDDSDKSATVAKPVVSVTPAAPVNSDDNEIIAVIAAAVASMYEGSEVKPVIRRIQKSSSNVRPAWTAAGIFENTRSF